MSELTNMKKLLYRAIENTKAVNDTSGGTNNKISVLKYDKNDNVNIDILFDIDFIGSQQSSNVSFKIKFLGIRESKPNINLYTSSITSKYGSLGSSVNYPTISEFLENLYFGYEDKEDDTRSLFLYTVGYDNAKEKYFVIKNITTHTSIISSNGNISLDIDINSAGKVAVNNFIKLTNARVSSIYAKGIYMSDGAFLSDIHGDLMEDSSINGVNKIFSDRYSALDVQHCLLNLYYGGEVSENKDKQIIAIYNKKYNDVLSKNIEPGMCILEDFSIKTSGDVEAQSFNALSDRRLKTNIVDYTPKKSILTLPIKEFDYITTEKHAIGCIAQDLQKICPEIVDEDDRGYLSIQESKIVYLLLDEVKKLRKELDELKERE